MSPTTVSQGDASQRAYAMTLRALDPARSVVVEACAGSGKTWLLASRIVRLLLLGVAPGEILAITFTRKAAREIEERVVDWLHLLATGSDLQVDVFLAERGVTADPAHRCAARALYEKVLGASPGLSVNTFHGWFLQLVAAAPLSANLAGATLVESDSRLFDELWQSFSAVLSKAPASDVTQRFIRLLADVGLESTRRLIRRALDRRSEWLAFAGAHPDGSASHIIAILRAQLGAGDPGTALADFFAPGWILDFQAYLGYLEMSELKGDQESAANLRTAFEAVDSDAQFEYLRSVLLTRENTLRAKKPGKTLDKRYTPEGASRFLALHAELGGRLLSCVEAQRAERILVFNQDVCTVFEAFLAHVEDFKRARRQIDFVDAEWNVLKLLRDEQTAAFLQARLDSRYRHVLLDEFQDTNPLQWQILLAWLDAYSDAARPTIFLVGDPKQSIYRFRRAEPRLFTVAADFLERSFDAVRCEQDTTRRNAQPLIDVVNALFLEQPDFAPFRTQTSFAGKLPGRVELMPLCGNPDDEEESDAVREGLRDSLIEPARLEEDSRLRQEAECLATKIGEMVGATGADGLACLIEDKGADGRMCERPARYGDFILLVRTRTHLAIYERALSAANIPFDAGSRGGLLAALEVRDVVALLEFLATPAADLKLAQTLRSPLFACSDDDLMLLAASGDASWWTRLQMLSQSGVATAHLVRAVHRLGEWLQAADRLPAHDLLDRIYHQGEVIARYRLAVPAALSASVEANLRALLLLALDLDGGRYPSLPRFIDELRDLRDADANDAPDEGVIGSLDAAAGRVRILTIHGAKGLEAPIVWLLGANASPRAQDAWDVLVDWPPEASSPQHFSFYGRKEDRGATRQPLFDSEADAARREELNLLYVAMTRARQVFIASGIETARENGKGGGSDTPYRLLANALRNLCGASVYGDELPRALQAVSPVMSVAARECDARPADEPLPVIGERRQAPDATERFGILLHALLERQTGKADRVDTWWQTLGFADSDYQRVLPVAKRLLAAPELVRFFDPARYRRAWNEIELCTRDGKIQRIDRLIEFDQEIWVVDYKSSGQQSSRLAEYRQQLGAYCQTVAEVFPGLRVRGGLIFSDASLLEID